MPAKARSRKESIPARLKPLFWDVPFGSLKLDKDRDLIIRRLLDRGDWEAVQWLRTQFTDRALRNWLLERRGAGLSPPKLRFWQLVLGLPERDVDDWLRGGARQVWDQRAFR